MHLGPIQCVYFFVSEEKIPRGLHHVLFCFGNKKHEVYSELYKQLKKFGTGGRMRTLVFPKWVRYTVRMRFGAGGENDDKYDNNPNVFIYSLIHLFMIIAHSFLCDLHQDQLPP